MYFTGNHGYHNFLFFAPMLNSLLWNRNGKVTNRISTGISSEKIKPFNAGLEPKMSNLSNARLTLKFNKFFFVI